MKLLEKLLLIFIFIQIVDVLITIPNWNMECNAIVLWLGLTNWILLKTFIIIYLLVFLWIYRTKMNRGEKHEQEKEKEI